MINVYFFPGLQAIYNRSFLKVCINFCYLQIANPQQIASEFNQKDNLPHLCSEASPI